MSKDSKRNINVCTIGSSRHGKTTLATALLKVMSGKEGKIASYDVIDNHSTVRKNGAAITKASVHYTSDKYRYTHIDYKGYIDLVKGLITNYPPIDTAILVCAADEGLTGQTREQLTFCQMLEIPNLVVFINKIEFIEDDERLELLELELNDLLRLCGYDPDSIRVVTGSALLALQNEAKHKQAILDLVSDMDECEEVRDTRPMQAHRNFNALIYLLSKDEGGLQQALKAGYKLTFHLGTSKEVGQCTLALNEEMVAPGDYSNIKVELMNPTAIDTGLGFTIHDGQQAVGVGMVTSLL